MKIVHKNEQDMFFTVWSKNRKCCNLFCENTCARFL